MKRFGLLLSILIVVVALPAVAQERSPDSSHVVLSPVPPACLANGTAVKGEYKYTCNKVDSSEVWNESEAEAFQKDIYEAFRMPNTETRIGLVVKQDSTYTRPMPVERNDTALVEQRKQGFKYRYVKR